MSIHIGNIIQEFVTENRISVTKLATLLKKNRSTVYHIFDRKGIDSELLLEISQKLKHNFFQYYSDDLEGKGQVLSDAKSVNAEKVLVFESQIMALKEKLEIAEREASYLREINALLKEKVGGE